MSCIFLLKITHDFNKFKFGEHTQYINLYLLVSVNLHSYYNVLVKCTEH